MSVLNISIVVPVYNVPSIYLKKCILSLIGQTFPNIEIIIVDDGSTDESGKICDDFSKRDKRINVFHTKNNGLSSARNYGVSKSKGKWIVFVDGDDYMEPNSFGKIFNEKNNIEFAEIVIFGSFRDNNNRHTRLEICSGFGFDKMLNKDELIELKKENLKFSSNLCPAFGKLYLKDFLTKNNLYFNDELRQGSEDIEFSYRLFDCVQKVVFINEYLYNYVYNYKSISSLSTDYNNDCVLFGFSLIKDQIVKDVENDYLIEAFNNRMIYVIITIVVSGIFHPLNKDKYKVKKNKLNILLEKKIVKDTMKFANFKNIDISRKITYFLIKYRIYFLLFAISRLRFVSKKL